MRMMIRDPKTRFQVCGDRSTPKPPGPPSPPYIITSSPSLLALGQFAGCPIISPFLRVMDYDEPWPEDGPDGWGYWVPYTGADDA